MFTLTKPQLLAALSFAGDKDIREYLNGIAVRPTGEIVATDNHRMLRYRLPNYTGPAETRIIPRDVLETACKLATKKAPSIEIELGDDAATIRAGGQFLVAKYVDGRYPDVDRVCPVEDAAPMVPSCGTMNTDYLLDARDAMHAFVGGTYKAVPFEQRRDDVIQVDDDGITLRDELPSFYRAGGLVMVVMPMRR